MNNLKIYEKNYKKKTAAIMISLVLGMTSTLGLSGCKKQEESDNQVVYTVPKNSRGTSTEVDILTGSAEMHLKETNKKQQEYKYVVDLNKLEDDTYSYYYILGKHTNLSDEELKKTNYKKDYLYSVRSGIFVDNLRTKFTNDLKGEDTISEGWSRGNTTLIVPDSYKWAEKLLLNYYTNADTTIIIDELHGHNGNNYVYYECKIEFPRDIKGEIKVDEEFYEKYGWQRGINKGDTIHYKALYLVVKDELKVIASEQTGIGSDCDNVKKELKGNINEIMMPISELGNDKKSKEFENYDEFRDYIDSEGIAQKKLTK